MNPNILIISKTLLSPRQINYIINNKQKTSTHNGTEQQKKIVGVAGGWGEGSVVTRKLLSLPLKLYGEYNHALAPTFSIHNLPNFTATTRCNLTWACLNEYPPGLVGQNL